MLPRTGCSLPHTGLQPPTYRAAGSNTQGCRLQAAGCRLQATIEGDVVVHEHDDVCICRPQLAHACNRTWGRLQVHVWWAAWGCSLETQGCSPCTLQTYAWSYIGSADRRTSAVLQPVARAPRGRGRVPSGPASCQERTELPRVAGPLCGSPPLPKASPPQEPSRAACPLGVGVGVGGGGR